MWSLGHLCGQGLTWAGPTTDAVQDQAVGLTQGETQHGQSCAWALSLASLCRHHQTPTLTQGRKLWQALGEEPSSVWLPSCLPAFLITQEARLGARCYPGHAASDVWACWGRGIPTSHCSQFPLFQLSSPHLGARAVARSCTRQHLMCFTGLHRWRGASLLPSCAIWHSGQPHHWAKATLCFTPPSSCTSFLQAASLRHWLEWAEGAPCQLYFVACVQIAAAGKASKGRENNSLPASSASFTSLHEAEQKKDALQCASV